MTVGTILLGVAMLILSGIVVARPLRDRPGRPAPAISGAAGGRYEASLLALRELEQDHQAGAVTADDYGRLREQLMVEAAAALEKEQQSQQQVLEAIETAVRSKRKLNKDGQRCSACAHELRFDDKFCPRCGTSAGTGCGSCGYVVEAGDKFCAACGQPL